MKISELTTEDLADYLKLDSEELLTQGVIFLDNLLIAALAYILSYTGLTAEEADVFEDLTIVVYVLVSDMYDTRAMYVDKGNVNKVVESILGLHARNLL